MENVSPLSTQTYTYCVYVYIYTMYVVYFHVTCNRAGIRQSLLLQILLFGFKSNRKFGKRLFLWDLVERVCEHMCASEVPTPLVSTAPQPGSSEKQLLCNVVNRINSYYTNIGKNEKVREGVFISCFYK